MISETLQSLDQNLFLAINQGHHSDLLDQFFLTITNLQKNLWVVFPVIALLIYALVKKYSSQFWKPLLILICTVGFTDLLCYRVIKNQVGRPRPFQNESFSPQVRKIGEAHGSSFPSNHAANSFAGATTLSFLFPHFSIFFFVYAALVAVSRVYVGVHYPFDIMFGALVGCFVSLSILLLFRNQIKTSTPPVH